MIAGEDIVSCFRVPLAAPLSACARARTEERGQSMVDYAVLTAVVVAAVAVAYQFLDLAQLIQTIFNTVTAALD
jgi:Flp pilus assembly pilin Flp